MALLETINITDVLTHLIYEVIRVTPAFYHIDINRVLVCLATNRNSRGGATFGKLVPLRFRDGATTQRFHNRCYTLPEIRHNDTQVLYLIYFYMPRFFDLPPREKLRVIFHELYHISTEFNGDIRRMGETKAAHGHSRKHFNSLFEKELDAFCAHVEQTSFYKFLCLDTQGLRTTFRKLAGRRMKVPRPVPVR